MYEMQEIFIHMNLKH